MHFNENLLLQIFTVFSRPIRRGEMKIDESRRAADLKFLIGVARALGGAIIFGLPLLMTMEMWWLGFYIERTRLLILLVLNVPLLVALSHFVGFEPTFGWKDDLLDALVAYAVGFLAAAPVLLLFGVIGSGMSLNEIIGKVSLQAVPGSIGALLAQSQFGEESGSRRKEKRRDTYAGETFFMATGALFLSLNVAPTEEIVLISYQMTPWHAVGLSAVSLALMHAFVYSVGFAGQSGVPKGTRRGGLFLRYTIVGYAICLAISLYILWTFGRTTDSAEAVVMATIVLAFPAAIGAASARLIL
jgi:putative integral membrane protein (TIGR02587 family)